MKCYYCIYKFHIFLHILNNIIFVLRYDLPVHISNYVNVKSKLILPIHFWLESDKIGKYDIGSLFGNPYLIVFPSNEITYEELYRLIIVRMGRYLKDGSGFNESTNSATNYKASTDEGMYLPKMCIHMLVRARVCVYCLNMLAVR